MGENYRSVRKLDSLDATVHYLGRSNNLDEIICTDPFRRRGMTRHKLSSGVTSTIQTEQVIEEQHSTLIYVPIFQGNIYKRDSKSLVSF